MVFEHEACAIGFAIAAATVEGYQVGAGVVVFGVAADGGSFFVDNGGLAEFGFAAALKRLGGLDLLHARYAGAAAIASVVIVTSPKKV